MSEGADYYMSWLGCNSFGIGSRTQLVAPAPVVFQPTDLSNCSIWYDATDNLTITADASNNVLSWLNKGDLSGAMVPYPGQAAPSTGNHDISGNNVIWFQAYQTLYTTNLAFPNQEYTIFVVTKTLSKLAVYNYADWFGGYDFGAFSAGLSEYLGTYYTGCGANAIDNYVMIAEADYPLDKPTIYSIRSSSDLSSNQVLINNVSYSLAYNSFSGYITTPTDFYIHIYTHASALDMGEIIVYNRAITDAEVLLVNHYLSEKWSITIV